MTTVEIPNRSLFRQPEVCEIAQVQPYVLRSWEAEFPDLGVSKTEGAARVYRRADLERVLHIKHLLFVEGLTLAGARRRLAEQAAATATAEEAESLEALLGSDARERILRVKQGLRELATILSRGPGNGHPDSLFDLSKPQRVAKSARKPPPVVKAVVKHAVKPAVKRAKAAAKPAVKTKPAVKKKRRR